MPVTKEPHQSKGTLRDTTLAAMHHASDAVRYAHQHPTAMLNSYKKSKNLTTEYAEQKNTPLG